MSFDELNKTLQKSMGLSNILSMQNNMYAAFEKSTGLANLLTGPNSVRGILEKNLELSQRMMGMNAIANDWGKHKAIWGLSSTDWIGQNSALQQMAMPKNVFNLTKGLGLEMAKVLSQDFGQNNAAKALTGGIASIMGDSSFGKALKTQNSILSQLVKLGPLSFDANQYRNVFNSLSSLSASMASKGFSSSLSNTYLAFLEDAANQAEEITNTIVEHRQVTTAEFDNIYNLINDFNNTAKSKDKSEFNTFGFWLNLICLFLTIYTIIQERIDSSNAHSTSDVQSLMIEQRNKFATAYYNNINLYSPVRLTNRKCNLLLKPRIKSSKIMSILPNSKLSVINTKGKWVVVTCLDKDSLPVTGWLLKKYLTKPKM